MKNLNWQEKIVALVREREHVPFEWGTHDCCLFAADCVKEITGTDYAAVFRGRYKTETGAKRLLVKAGGLTAVLDKSFERIEKAYIQRGDLVQVQTDYGPALGIAWLGNGVWLHSPEGVRLFVNIDHLIVKAWRV